MNTNQCQSHSSGHSNRVYRNRRNNSFDPAHRYYRYNLNKLAIEEKLFMSTTQNQILFYEVMPDNCHVCSQCRFLHSYKELRNSRRCLFDSCNLSILEGMYSCSRESDPIRQNAWQIHLSTDNDGNKNKSTINIL